MSGLKLMLCLFGITSIFFVLTSKKKLKFFLDNMPLAERPGMRKKLQFLMADSAISTWIQDSRFRAQTKLLGSNLSGFKIQDARFKAEAPLDLRSFFRSRILNLESSPLGFKKFFLDLESWIQPPWIQKVFSGSRILNLESSPLGFKKFFLDLESWILNPAPLDSRSFFRSRILNLESSPLGFKKFFLDLESWIQPPWIQEVFSGSRILNLESSPLGFKKFFLDLESWILNPAPLDSRSFFWISNLESWIQPPWIQEVFSGSRILNLESSPLDSRSFFWISNLESWIQPPWIQEVFSGSRILNLESSPLGFKKFFLDLESWILNPAPLDSRSFFWISNLESWIQPPWIQEVFSGSRILNLESSPLGFKKFFLDLESWILNPAPLDSRSCFWISNLESWIQPPWIQEFFSGSRILNLESSPLGFKKFFLDLESWILNPAPLDSRSFFWISNLESWIQPPWIQEVFSGSRILNLESSPLGFKKFFLDLESWILNPAPLDSRSFFWISNLESWIRCREGWNGNKVANKNNVWSKKNWVLKSEMY